MKIIDTHAHYNHSKYSKLTNILKEMNTAGVIDIVNVGTNTRSIKESLNLSNKYNFVHSVIGYFPCDVMELEQSATMFEQFKNICKTSDIKGIGEIGLDYYWNKPSQELQKKWFKKQIELAIELKLPICIHSRDSKDDTMSILREYPEAFGVVHCYSYDSKTALELCAMGYYFGIGGTSTYKGAIDTVDTISKIPMDRLVVETDAPYLTPIPWRGQLNRSEYLSEVIKNIAFIKKINIKTVESALIENSRVLYNLK